ncbi:MAG: hypothetical protein ACLFQX_03160 [Candidatus Kapaibacterium sp.]
MATLGIESNGRLEKTAIYYNGEQFGGVKEIFLNLDEDGTFDAIIQYEDVNKEIHTKQIFDDFLAGAKFVAPSFTEDEAADLQLLVVESNGDIEETMVFLNDEPLEGITSLFVHIKGSQNKNGIKSLFSTRREVPDEVEFRAEITFRNEDESIETEDIF